MRCLGCGNENPEGALVCSQCGTRLPKNLQEEQQINSVEHQRRTDLNYQIDNNQSQSTYQSPNAFSQQQTWVQPNNNTQQYYNQNPANTVITPKKPKRKLNQKQKTALEVAIALLLGVFVAVVIIISVNSGGHSKAGEYVNDGVSTTQTAELPGTFSVGDEIEFGVYEQDNTSSNGKEAIVWQVIAVDDNRALLLSKYTLDYKKFENSFSDTNWADSYMHQWLSQSFVQNSFTQNQATRIIETNIATNKSKGKKESANTSDRVFLLSKQEYVKYVQDTEFMLTQPTEYAKAQGAEGDIVKWALRSLGKGTTYICYVDETSIKYSGPVNNGYDVRPAMWVTIE